MKKSMITLLTVCGLLAAWTTPAQAGEGKDKTVKGKGLCAKCALDEASSCQNAVQFKKEAKEGEEAKKVTVYMAKNDVAKDFHGEICKSTKPVVARGDIKKVDGKYVLTAKNIELQSDMTLTGLAQCGKCSLKETSSCQTAIQAKENGKDVTYFLTSNDTAKDFHSNVCQGKKKVKAKGALKEKDGKNHFTAKKIELQ
jgi:hypothetical protein